MRPFHYKRLFVFHIYDKVHYTGKSDKTRYKTKNLRRQSFGETLGLLSIPERDLFMCTYAKTCI